VNVDNCARLAKRHFAGTWSRAVPLQHAGSPLATAQTTSVPSRFSHASAIRPGFEILYLAETPVAAQFEIGKLFGPLLSPIENSGLSFACVNVRFHLSAVADLTDPLQAAIVETNAQELTGDWRHYSNRASRVSPDPHAGLAPTQELGRALFLHSGYAGFVTFSAKLPQFRVVGIFMGRLESSGSLIEYEYTDGHGDRRFVCIPERR
jgi:hypothetical protein